MALKAVKVFILCVIVPALLALPAFAQDFGTLVANAATLNQQWVSQTDAALQATTLASVQSQAATAIASGKQVQALLNEALPLAPDNASRSRIQGLQAHVNAGLQDGQRAAQETSFDAARGDVNAMRGEAAEAFNELAPFATQQPTKTTPPTTATTLPQTGGVPIELPMLVGACVLVCGYVLRTWREASSEDQLLDRRVRPLTIAARRDTRTDSR